MKPRFTSKDHIVLGSLHFETVLVNLGHVTETEMQMSSNHCHLTNCCICRNTYILLANLLYLHLVFIGGGNFPQKNT